MHICMDEVFAVLTLLPWVGAGVVWVRTKWRAWAARRDRR